MKNKIVPILLIIFFIGGIYYFVKGNKKPDPKLLTTPVLYVGEGCEHCAKVEQFMKDQKVERKLGLLVKEIYKNPANMTEMKERAAICGAPTDKVGIPFLWNGDGCNIGDDSIIKYLKKMLDAKK